MLKNLRSLFIIDETPDKKKEDSSIKKQTTTPVVKKGTVKSSQTKSVPIVPSKGKVNPKFMDILFKAMEKNNLDGFDYLEFKQSLKSLSKMPMDEATRFKSAFAMAQTMGATPAKLKETAEYYLTVLGREKKQFEEAVTQQKSKQIGNKEAEIKQLQKVIVEKKKQIAQIQKEIEEHEKKMKANKAHIEKATVKVTSTKNDFMASYDALTGQLKHDIEKMTNYLK